MLIPLDKFQILGVGVGKDAREILRILDQRIHKLEHEGFTDETLKKREEMLEDICSELLEGKKGKEYDNELSAKILEGKDGTFEVKDGYEIAAFLLMLETGYIEECLELAYNLSRRKNTRDTKELSRVLDCATLEYSKRLKEKRYYEEACRAINKRLSTNGDVEILAENKVRMKEELEILLPYRILDLISRARDEPSRTLGIKLLIQLVQKRGGLESASQGYMSPEEFKSFFRQIRQYLSLQEQIDLFIKWSKEGSETATFLTAIAMTASGFVQRKPERISDSLDLLKRIRTDDVKPMMANLYLLLGDIETASELFERFADDKLKEWAHDISNNKLGQLCEWCREWLRTYVLPGYLDLKAEVNMEAYFGDRDVISYIEYIDNEKKEKSRTSELKGIRGETRNTSTEFKLSDKYLWNLPRYKRDTRGTSKNQKKLFFNSKKHRLIGLAGILSGVAIIVGILNSMDTGKKQERIKPAIQNKSKETSRQISPEAVRVNEVISRYLEIKRKALATGTIPKGAEEVMSENRLRLLMAELKYNRERNQTQRMNAKIEHIKILEKTSTQIRVRAILIYEDTRIDNKGLILDKTPRHKFEKTYTLVDRRGGWVLN